MEIRAEVYNKNCNTTNRVGEGYTHTIESREALDVEAAEEVEWHPIDTYQLLLTPRRRTVSESRYSGMRGGRAGEGFPTASAEARRYLTPFSFPKQKHKACKCGNAHFVGISSYVILRLNRDSSCNKRALYRQKHNRTSAGMEDVSAHCPKIHT